MSLRHRGDFAGGIDLPDEKHATLDKAIERCPLTPALLVPLAPAGLAAAPCVKIGQRVRAGERIAIAAAPEDRQPTPEEILVFGGSVDIFAPLDGTVRAFKAASCAGADDFETAPAIELADLSWPSERSTGILPMSSMGVPPMIPGVAGENVATVPAARRGVRTDARPQTDWASQSPQQLRDLIRAGGLTTFRRPPQVLWAWLAQAANKQCRRLILNAVESEPYVTASHRLLVQRPRDVIQGLAILARAAGIAETILAADHRRTDDYRVAKQCRALAVRMVAVGHKYPAGADAILVAILTGEETPPGQGTMYVKSAVIDVATCLAAYDWLVNGLPPTCRTVTVAGERIAKPGNYLVPFGTPCSHLADNAKPPLLHNGPMAGIRCADDAVVGPATDALLAIQTADAPRKRPCIRCAWCWDHCPAKLNVAALNDDFELNRIAHARRLDACACVECGICTYVCPAKLPLAQRVKQLKRAIYRTCSGTDLFLRI
jgi:electron transport complex protein RnfC